MYYIAELLANNAIKDKSTRTRLVFEVDTARVDRNAFNALKFLKSETLIRCDLSNCNGMDQFGYNVDGLTTLASVFEKASVETFNAILSELFGALLDVAEHGLLRCECILLDFYRIYIRGSDVRPMLVYVPVSGNASAEKDRLFIAELCDKLAAVIKSNKNLAGANPRLNRELNNKEATLESLKAAVDRHEASDVRQKPVKPVEVKEPEPAAPAASNIVWNHTIDISEESWRREVKPESISYYGDAQRSEGNVSSNDATELLGNLDPNGVFVLCGYRQNANGQCISEKIYIPIRAGETIIGRSDTGTDYQLGISPYVGRIHCKIICEMGSKPGKEKLFIMDIGITSDNKKGTRNGTFVKTRKNPIKYNKKTRISVGDKIWLADVMLVVERSKSN